MNDILEIAKNIQFNAKAEAEAVEYYTELLRLTNESNIDETDKKYIESVIQEIISDELNHSLKLQTLYTALTDIKANKD